MAHDSPQLGRPPKDKHPSQVPEHPCPTHEQMPESSFLGTNRGNHDGLEEMAFGP
jgi:hypothetical protein